MRIVVQKQELVFGILTVKKLKMIHKIVNKIHIIEVKGRINVYTEKEYQQLEQWDLIKLKYFKT